MAPLTKGRTTPEFAGDFREQSVAAGAVIYTGAMLMRNAAGDLLPGAVAAGGVGVGRANHDVNNTGGAAGDVTVRYKRGCFGFANGTGGDEITKADIGNVCFILDDQTVARVDGGGARSPAGIIDDVAGAVVHVRFDEALTKAAAA
ncbi:MAG: hypothetical protein ACFB11_00815 [Paracoccaceae bacterium]